MAPDLEQQFHAAMLEIYRRAKAEAGYNASRFLQMVSESTGVEAARTLLHAARVSEGYAALWERGRLDLTVEALVLDPRYRLLFTSVERNIARKRLLDYGYTGNLPNDDYG